MFVGKETINAIKTAFLLGLISMTALHIKTTIPQLI